MNTDAVSAKLRSIDEKKLLVRQLRNDLAYSLTLADIFPDAFTDDHTCSVERHKGQGRKVITARRGVHWIHPTDHYVITNNDGLQCCVLAKHWDSTCAKFLDNLLRGEGL